MKRNCFLTASICLLAMMVFVSCTQKFPGYKKTAQGLYYKFYNQNPTADQPKLTDFMKVEMACYLHDSLYYDWQGSGNEVFAQLKESYFAGDLQEAYAMMHVGDSASFYIKSDSIAVKYYDQNPDSVGLKADDYFRYEVKLVEVQTQEEFQAGIEKMKQALMDDTRKVLADYVTTNNINVKPDASGIYIIPLEKGKGRCPVKGEKVEIDFSVSLLNGKMVGSTFDMPENFSFVLGDNTVIPGWEAVLPQLHLGDRVKAIIPCEMAYGERSVGEVPSYSNLIYDIKLLKITGEAELQAEREKEMKVLKAESEKAFLDYLSANQISDHTTSGVFYTKSVVTEGEQAQVGKVAQINFVASYLDGTPLGSSEQLGGPYEVPVGQGKVLKGLDEGIAMMRVGEKARFVVPYTLAYGTKPYNSIPAYSNLIFDVELLNLVNATK